jgi:hypothetical protein
MGSGLWSAGSFHERVRAKKARGEDTFDYSVKAKQSGVLQVHQTLDPRGMPARESRDSAEHPLSNSILIGLDVTGSMDAVVRAIHANLPSLLELLLGQKYVSDPQILFAAVGDAVSDRVPVQVGQFESDNRMDQHLENMIIEGGGGGSMRESYELLLYLAARKTSIDCFEKRGRKGYLFIIGDEMAYTNVSALQVKTIFQETLQADVTLEEIYAQAAEKYHIYFIVPGGASHGGDAKITEFWQRIVGPERVIKLDDPADTSKCIALTIGVNEGVVHPQQVAKTMESSGEPVGVIARILAGLKSILRTPAVTPPEDRRL